MNVSKTLTESITKIIQELKNKKNDCFTSLKSKQKDSGIKGLELIHHYQ